MSLRLLHLMIHVRDLDRSLAFYVGVMGMRELRRVEAPEEGRTAAFVGYGDERDATVLELTFRRGFDAFGRASAFGHIAIETAEITAFCDHLRRNGHAPTVAPKRIANGKTIAFLEDPDGNQIELVQPAATN